MTSIHIKTNGSSITAKADGKLTSGMVGISVTIEYDEAWIGLSKTAVFKVGDFVRDRKNIDTETTVPWEVMRRHGGQLLVGLEGKDQDGNIVMPTIFSPVGTIYQGALSGIPGSPNPDFGEETQSNAVLFVQQYLTEKQQAQAKENIGASTYYHTKREASWGNADVDDNGNLPTQYVWDLYDALADKYNRYEVDKNGEKIPLDIRVRKVDCSIGDFEQYAYEISTGDYSTDAAYVQHYGNNPPIKKPKYLVLSGIHGIERKAVFSTYRFFRDLLSGHNIPAAFQEGAIFSVMPVGTPNSFDLFIRNNAPTVYDEAGKVVSEGVNINRNFNAENPEKETQAIANWLNANADADLFIDVHNNGALNEKVLILGLPDNTTSNTARKTALRGVDNIIPYWRDVIGYPDKVEAEGLDGTITNRAVIYSYTATINTDGLSIKYAQNVVGIPSITIELASFYGSTTEWLDGTWKDGKLVPGKNAKKADSPEAVAMGAEALGNILLEFYKQEDMLLPESGTPIYNGEALFIIKPTQTQIYNGEVEYTHG